MSDRIYTTVDLAKVCRVSLRTVIRWVDEGKLTSFRTPGGHRRVREEDLLEFLDRYQIPFSLKAAAGSKKVLLVESKKTIERLLHQILRRSSDRVEITVARDLYEGCIRIGLVRPDLVIVSASRMGRGLMAFCRALRGLAETKRTKVLLLGGGFSEADRRELQSLRVEMVTKKSYTLEELRPELLKMLGESSARSH